MAVGDHRYFEDRWRSVLINALQSPRDRIKLVRDPQRAADIWGFCGGGLAFLRILSSVESFCGEEEFQRGIDRFLATLERFPGETLAVANGVARIMHKLDTSGALKQVADKLERIRKRGARP